MSPEAKGRKEDDKSDKDSSGVKKNSSSYADRLKSNVSFSQRLNRNILEILLEKSKRPSFSQDISTDSIANVFKTLGIDISTQLEGYQIHHKGFISTISVWFREGVNVEKFCKDISIRVNDEVRTGLIRPAGKPEVTVTIAGLDFNTPDTLVMEYLNMEVLLPTQ